MFKRKPIAAEPRQRQAVTSQRAHVFSYHAQRSPETSSERNPGGLGQQTTAIKPQSRSTWFVMAAIAFLLLAGGIAWDIKPTTSVAYASNTSQLHSSDDYADHVSAWLRQNPFNRIKFVINESALEMSLQSAYPEVVEADFSAPIFGSLALSTRVSPPMLILNGGNGQYIVDDQGRSVLEANSTELTNQLPVVDDQSNLTIKKGQQVLTRQQTAFIAMVHAQLINKEMTGVQYALPSQSNELQLRFGDRPYLVRMNMQADARQQVGGYLSITKKLDADGVEVKEYIDVRVDERVYYK